VEELGRERDESVLHFFMMKPGEKFTMKLANEVEAAIRKELSLRHVPKLVFETLAVTESLGSA
jgi:acetoacetyl-CoA synthetase